MALSMLDHFALLKDVADWSQRREELVEGRLARVNLWKVRYQHLHGFSGGMRQRLGMAQALSGQTYLIIVDEPTAGLDPEERHRGLDLLATCGENAVVILATHLVEDVAVLCPRMASSVFNQRQQSITICRGDQACPSQRIRLTHQIGMVIIYALTAESWP